MTRRCRYHDVVRAGRMFVEILLDVDEVTLVDLRDGSSWFAVSFGLLAVSMVCSFGRRLGSDQFLVGYGNLCVAELVALR